MIKIFKKTSTNYFRINLYRNKNSNKVEAFNKNLTNYLKIYNHLKIQLLL